MNQIINSINSKKFRIALWDRMPINFEYTSDLRKEVFCKIELQIIRLNADQIKIVYFKSKLPWSKSYGYVSKGDNSTIYINSRKVMNQKQMAKFIMHELCHFAGYGHGNNYVYYKIPWLYKKKMDSVNRKLATITERIYDNRF